MLNRKVKQERSGRTVLFLLILGLGLLTVYFFPFQGRDVSTRNVAMVQLESFSIVRENQIAGFVRAMRLARFIRFPIPVCNRKVTIHFHDDTQIVLEYPSANPPLHWYLNALCV